jgi:ABC-type polysaccharide/polyol phosphate export permease
MSARKTVYSSAQASGVGATLRDLREGFEMGPVWRTFAWDEIQSRYRRSVLGLAWIAISYVLFVLGIAVIFGGLMNRGDAGYVHYVAIGYATFLFLMSNVSEGCGVFYGSASWLKSSSMPYSVYVYKGIARALFPFLVQMVVAIVIMLATGWRPTPSILLVPFSLLIVLITAVPVQLMFGFLGAWSRDVGHLVQSLTRLLIFLTPIIWTFDSRSGAIRQIALFNPFTHYLEIFRAPLLGEPILPQSLYIVPCLTVAAWVVAILVAARLRKHLPFWV